jgi:hypothetical protein
VPGPSTAYFGKLAKQHDLYLVVGLVERDGKTLYNTSALIGPDGEMVGKYRKVTLPRGEVEAGITPGREYPVFDTRFGKVGMMICYDGFFPEVARALFEQAAAVLREAGLDILRGPYNPSINDDCGVLLNGFDRPTMIGLPWNPPYYTTLLEGLGFAKARTLYILTLPLSHLRPPERFERIIERLKKRANLSMRPIALPRLEEELEIVRRVYNATLERNWGFVPIGLEDLITIEDYSFLEALATDAPFSPSFREAVDVVSVQQALINSWDSKTWETVTDLAGGSNGK